jgi:hypothetical protein
LVVPTPNEAHPVPPPLAAALDELRKVLVGPDGAPIDPITAEWSQIERGVILLLGGAFSPREPRHLEIAFMLAAALAERLHGELGAFWFQNRSTPHGATLGFPEAMVMFSPIDAVFQALGRSNLAALADADRQLRAAVAEGKLRDGVGRSLRPEDYQAIFDPGLLQLVALDPAALGRTLATSTDEIVRDFEHGFSKLSREIPEDARTQVAREVTGALKRLPAGPLGDQIPRAPQLVELVTLATATVAASGIAPVEFWEQLLLPLLHVGASDAPAELDDDELEAYRQGAEPLLIYVDVVPYKTPAADEDGLLGVFPPDQVKLLDPRWGQAPAARLLGLDPSVLRDLCAGFDPEAVRGALDRFAAACAQAAGQEVAQPTPPPGRPGLRDMVLMLAADLKRLMALVEDKGLLLALRYGTESEASSEPILQDLRRALREPRIVLA